jgi:hypothetical protein
MASRVIEHQPQVERGVMIQLKDQNEPAVIQPDQVWHHLTSLQQHLVAHCLVKMGRQLVQRAMTQEGANEHL